MTDVTHDEVPETAPAPEAPAAEPAAAEPEAETPAATAPAVHTESAIAHLEHWLHAHVYDSVISQETALFNRIHALVQEVKAELQKLV